MSLALTSQIGVANSAPGFLSPGLQVPELYAPPNPSAIAGLTLPLIARVFGVDGVTFVISFDLLDRPALKYTVNGSSQPLVLRVASSAKIAAVGLGNIVQLAEQGGDGTVLYTGIVESLPVSYGVPDTQIEIELNPIGAEVGYTDFDKAYTTATEIAQMVRDAVAATMHLWCTPQSVPDTGITDSYSFTKSHVVDVLDTCRTFAGPNYFWFVAPNGQVWFHPQGSAAQYVLKQGQDYTVSKAGPSVTDMRNSFTVLGGMVQGASAPLTAVYSNPTSIALYGKRTIQPNPYYPEVGSQAGLNAIRDTLGTIFDRTTSKTSLGVPNYARRIWPAQPGGALVQYWETASMPSPESIGGSGTYSAAFFARDVTIDGPAQQAVLDQFPVSLDDLNAMLHRIAARITTYPLVFQPAGPNTAQVVSSGFSIANAAGPNSRYVLDENSLRVYDAAGALRVELGNIGASGASVAMLGGRLSDAAGAPIVDSLGLLQALKLLFGTTSAFSRPGVAVTGVATPTPGLSGIGGEKTLASSSFTLARQATVLLVGRVTGFTTYSGGSPYQGAQPIDIRCSGQAAGPPGSVLAGPNGLATTPPTSCTVLNVYVNLAVGTYTPQLIWNSSNGTADTLTYHSYALHGYQIGG